MLNQRQYIHVALVIRELIRFLCPVKSIVPVPSPQNSDSQTKTSQQ